MELNSEMGKPGRRNNVTVLICLNLESGDLWWFCFNNSDNNMQDFLSIPWCFGFAYAFFFSNDGEGSKATD